MMMSLVNQVTNGARALFRRVAAFFLTPASPRPLGALRIGLAAVLIVQAFLVRDEIFSFFARDGLVQGALAEYLSERNTPRLSWLVAHLAPYGVSETACILWTARIYFVSLICLLLGMWTRAATVVAFFLQWTLMNSGYCSPYGFDTYAHIFLFYLIWVPAGDAYSLDRALGRTEGRPSPEARLGLRLMQLHVALAYLASGIEKSLSGQWWNGEQIWRTLSLSEYKQFDMSWIHSWPIIAMVAGWGTLVIETFFCVFIWPRRTRPLWILLTVSMHVAIAIFLGLQIFGAIMCVLIISLFGFSAQAQGGRPHGSALPDEPPLAPLAPLADADQGSFVAGKRLP